LLVTISFSGSDRMDNLLKHHRCPRSVMGIEKPQSEGCATRRRRSFFATLLICAFGLRLTVGVLASSDVGQALEKFSHLPGREKIAALFEDKFHGRSFLFWKRSAEVWRNASDARLSFEEEILIASADPEIDDALGVEIRSSDVNRARYAVFLACLRARFVPESEFLVKGVRGVLGDGVRSGDISPFKPNLERLGPEVGKALRGAIESPNVELRTTAKLYTFTLLDELSTLPAVDIAKGWRTELARLPCYSYTPLAYSEAQQSVYLHQRALASTGLDSVVAISSLLKVEVDPAMRYQEIEMLRFLDAAVVRLRGSQAGREAIANAKNSYSKDLRYCGQKLFRFAESRKRSWRLLEGQFRNDSFDSGLGSWATIIAMALDQEYGGNFSIPFGKDARVAGPRVEQFLSELTELDSTFPAWEFPSTATRDDMLNPAFLVKIQRYQDALSKVHPQK
jgi:hypothetical protein